MKIISLNKILILAIIIAVIIISILYSKILLPFFIGAFIAYLLNPLVVYAENKKINRNLASLVALVLFLGFILLFSLSVLPIIIQQTLEFLDRFPNLVKRVEDYMLKISKLLNNNILEFDNINILKDFHDSLAIILKKIVNKLLFSSIAIMNLFSLIIITPIVTWYFLKDWNKIIFFIKNNIPVKYQSNIENNFNEVDVILSSFIRGQFLVSIILAIFYFIAFYLVGLDHAIFLAMFSGIFSLIPYFGIIISFLLSSYIAVLQFTDLFFIVWIILIFLISFLLEGYFLSPKIIGEKLGLHPLAILYSIFIFGSVLGFVGVFFAIPFASIIFLYYKKILFSINNIKNDTKSI
ncbi:MAG: hypothetical protein CMJ13_08590 [Pelagibacterales bacterium]|nr:hypothetical protein [Pelagibacterales bacterium]